MFVPGPAFHVFVALTSVGLYVPFSLHVTFGQDYLPTRVCTAGGITLGLTVSVGGLVTPLIGATAGATSLRTALAPPIVLPALSWLLFRGLPEPTAPKFRRSRDGEQGSRAERHDARACPRPCPEDGAATGMSRPADP